MAAELAVVTADSAADAANMLDRLAEATTAVCKEAAVLRLSISLNPTGMTLANYVPGVRPARG